jgi:hypothetical protein
MGGFIEDRIFEVLLANKLTTKEIIGKLEETLDSREYGTINKHLRKMYFLKQLKRERINGQYLYWNPCMAKN